MVTGRTHRMTELFGRLAPGATLEEARAELTAVHASMMRAHPEAYSAGGNVQLRVSRLRDQIAAPARTILLVLLAAAGDRVRHRLLERRQPDPGAIGAPRRGAGGARRARRGHGRAPAHAAGREPGAVRRGGGARASRWRARSWAWSRATPPASRCARSTSRSIRACSGWAPAWRWRRPCCWPSSRACPRRRASSGLGAGERQFGSRRARIAACASSRRRRSRSRSCCSPAPACCWPRSSGCETADTGYDMRHVLVFDIPASATGVGAASDGAVSTRKPSGASRSCPASSGVAIGSFVPWRDADTPRPRRQVRAPTATRPPTAKRIRARGSGSSRPDFFSVLGVPLLAGRDFSDEDRAGSELGRHRQPERRAAAVPERRRAQPDRCGGRIRTSAQADAPPHRRRRGRRRRRARRARPAMTVYHPVRQIGIAVRLFVRASGDPYALVPSVTRASSGRLRRTSRSNAPPRSRTSARRCCRPSG